MQWGQRARNSLWLALFFVTLIIGSTTAHADPGRWTRQDVLDRLQQSDAQVWCIVRIETGGTFEPYKVGDYGTSFGPVQLHKGGRLEAYYSWWSERFEGYPDPFSPRSIDFFEYERSVGNGHYWTGSWPYCQ